MLDDNPSLEIRTGFFALKMPSLPQKHHLKGRIYHERTDAARSAHPEAGGRPGPRQPLPGALRDHPRPVGGRRPARRHGRRAGGRPDPAAAAHGQALLRHPGGHPGRHPDLRQAGRGGRGGLRVFQDGLRRGGLYGRPGRAVHHPRRGKDPPGRLHRLFGQGPASPARQVPRREQPGDLLPPALPGPVREPGHAGPLFKARGLRAGGAPLPGGPRLRGDRDPGAQRPPLRGHGAALRVPPQRPGSGRVPAHRAGDLPQAGHRGGLYQGL